MKLPDKRRDYLDQEVYQLVSLIETSVFAPIQRIDYVLPDDIIDLSDKVIGAFTTTEKINSQIVSIKRCEGNICRHIEGEVYKKYIKFVEVIYKSAEINPTVSKKFLLNLVLDYIIEAHKLKKCEGNFSDYLLDKIEEEVRTYKVYFTIHNLEISQPLSIGKVFFSKIEPNIVIEDQVKYDAKSVTAFFKKYGSKLFATFIVKAEKQRAVEIAFQECSLAVDVLKICCDTMDDPLAKISFDIDSRVTETLSAEIIVSDTIKQNDISISVHRIPNFHQITDEYRKRLEHRNLNFFQGFLLTLPVQQTELHKLILNAIKRFAKALSNNNLNQRVAELFTIMESLLVPNAQANIIESLTKYCSKLIYKERTDRVNLIKLIKSMYEVRSAYIHHANELEIDVEDLTKLQHCIQALIGKLIEKSRTFSDKIAVLKEIDDAILDAF